MPQIREPLFWDDDDHNVNRLWERHAVTVEEGEQVLFGVDGEPPNYFMFHDGEFGDYYAIFGQTGDGSLLRLSGEFVQRPGEFEGSRFRVFHAMAMNRAEKQRFNRARGSDR